MIRFRTLMLAAVFAGMPFAAAHADWDAGDSCKMHYPQLPDPNGWDVGPMQHQVADDWTCSQTGTVSDLHFWVSFEGNGGAPAAIDNIYVKIYESHPSGGPMSSAVWFRTFAPSDWTARLGADDANQGWYDPWADTYRTKDHSRYYQINITDIADPLEQQMDQVYWLSLAFELDDQAQASMGWTTSLDSHGSGAVYRYGGQWHDLVDPITQTGLNMAFVITPEPATLSLLGVAGLAMIRRRRTVG